jgi:hypothetical protein
MEVMGIRRTESQKNDRADAGVSGAHGCVSCGSKYTRLSPWRRSGRERREAELHIRGRDTHHRGKILSGDGRSGLLSCAPQG